MFTSVYSVTGNMREMIQTHAEKDDDDTCRSSLMWNAGQDHDSDSCSAKSSLTSTEAKGRNGKSSSPDDSMTNYYWVKDDAGRE